MEIFPSLYMYTLTNNNEQEVVGVTSQTKSGGHQGAKLDLGTVDAKDSRPTEEGSPSLSDDGMFKVLSNQRRRQVLNYLRDGDGSATVGELAEYIAAEENNTTIQQLSSQERKRVYVSLYQNHLPVMDAANVINYEENRKRVHLLETVTKIEPYLTEDSEGVDNRVLAAVALMTATFLLLGISQASLFAAVPTWMWPFLGVVGVIGVFSLKLYNYRAG